MARPVDDGVATLTLAAGERGNALSAALVTELAAAFEEAIADPALHTVIFDAQGRHFCTGFDVSALDDETDATLLARFVAVELLLDRIWRAPLRTVAIGQGRIMGAGADLFAACDLRLLADGATLSFPGAGFGLVLGTRRLAVRVGEARALDWVAGRRLVDVELALASGLASERVAAPAAGSLRESVLAALGAGPAVDRPTYAALKAAAQDGCADADLAALVRSAARPGLHRRLSDYRARQLAARRR